MASELKELTSQEIELVAGGSGRTPAELAKIDFVKTLNFSPFQFGIALMLMGLED